MIAPIERQLAWERLGALPEGVMTADEALVAGGLDWEVAKHPLMVGRFRGDGQRAPRTGITTEINERHADFLVGAPVLDKNFAMLREDSGALLGFVGKDYQPFQNADAFRFLDDLVDSGDAHYVAAVPLKGGRWVAITMRVPKHVLVGGEDRVDLYIVIIAAHDGTKAITGMVTPIRVLCTNTARLALRTAVNRWAVRHTGDVQGRLLEARRALDLSFRYMDEFEKDATALANAPMTDSEFEQFVDAIRPPNDKQREGLLAAWEDTTTHGQDNRWDALNTVTEYLDWGRDPRNARAQLMSTYFGDAGRVRDRAFKVLAQSGRFATGGAVALV